MTRGEAMEIFQMKADKMKNTQSIQWKMNLSIWTLIVLTLSVKIKDMSFEVSVWILAGFCIIHFFYCLLTQRTINSDKAVMEQIANGLNETHLDDISNIDIAKKGKMLKTGWWWIILQWGVTALLSSILVYCTPRKTQESNNEIVKLSATSYKISSNNDSIVLVGTAPFYDRVQIFREKKKILDYTDKDLQINSIDKDGNESKWFTEHNGRGEYLYIIDVFNAPEPSRFLIIKATKAQTAILGTTEPNTAEIFGDIDRDGKFEIGGLSMYCQGGDTTCHSVDYYRVFEVAPNFPTDIALNDFFKNQFLQKK